MQTFFFISIILMMVLTIFVMPSKPILYGYFAWIKHALFIIFWISNSQIKKKQVMYSMEVVKAQKEFEDITDARIIIQNSKSIILFYFKKEEFMELSRDSNVTQKHLEIYRFVSKSQNDLGRMDENESVEKKPLYSEQRKVTDNSRKISI
jgi:hypothetical protein